MQYVSQWRFPDCDPATWPSASPTRSSSTTAPTRPSCAPPARPCCASWSPPTARWSPASTRGAGSDALDLGAFLYALNRLPANIWRARLIAMGQEATAFQRANLGDLDAWETIEAPARRRRWHDDGKGMLAVLIASSSDLDDLIPTLVAYQIEWNKLHEATLLLELPEDLRPSWCAERLGGSDDDWDRVTDAWNGDLRAFLDAVREVELDLRIRMLGSSEVGYGRVTRRWWDPILTCLREQGLGDRNLYLVSSNTHSLVNLVTGTARLKEDEIVELGRAERPALPARRAGEAALGRARGSWDNFLYYCTRLYYDAAPEDGPEWAERRAHEREVGVTHIPSYTAVRVSSQVIDPARWDASVLDPRLADVDAQTPAELRRRDRQHRLSARGRRLQHPARDRRVDRHAARRVRAGQGRDAERRRGRRADLQRHPRRALGLDLLAGQRVQLRRHPAVADVRLGPGQPARGDGQVDVPAEPPVPRLLLPRGVHGRRDGGRAVLQRRLRDRRPRPLSDGRVGELRQAADRLRRDPLRLGHAVHAGAHARRPRAVLLRDGLHVRVVAGDPAPHPAPGGRAQPPGG